MIPWKKKKGMDPAEEFKAIEKIVDELVKEFADSAEVSGEITSRGMHFSSEDGRPISYGFSLKIHPGEKPVFNFHEMKNSQKMVEQVPRDIHERKAVERIQERRTVEPLTEITEEKDSYLVVMHLPGIEKKDLQIRLSDSNTFSLVSFSVDNPYTKTLRLANPVELQETDVKMNNGILELKLKKSVNKESQLGRA